MNEGAELNLRNVYARCNELTDRCVRAILPEGRLTVENSCFVENMYNQGTAEASPRTTFGVEFPDVYENGSTPQFDTGRDLCLGVYMDVDRECFPFAAEQCGLTVDGPYTTNDCPARRLTEAPTPSPTAVPSGAACLSVNAMATSAAGFMLTVAALL